MVHMFRKPFNSYRRMKNQVLYVQPVELGYCSTSEEPVHRPPRFSRTIDELPNREELKLDIGGIVEGMVSFNTVFFASI